MRHDLLSDVLHVINNAEKIGRRTVVVPASSLVKEVLSVIQKAGYIGDFEFLDDGRSGHFRIDLIRRINRSRTIKPRFAVGKDEFEKWETRYLPAKDFGILIVSTSKGMMTHKEAGEAKIGGRLIAYVY